MFILFFACGYPIVPLKMASFPFPFQNHERTFLKYLLWGLCRTPGSTIHKCRGVTLWLGPPGNFNFQTCPYWASSTLSIFFLWVSFFFFFKDFIYLFLERGREGERGRKHHCVVASCVPPTEDLARNPGMCPRLGIEPMTLWFVSPHSICWARPLVGFYSRNL